MPVFAIEMSDSKLEEKIDSKNLDTGSSFLEIIEMILEAIGKMVKAIFPKRK
jgi:predicted house-cleaning noncanonical NTP pyrophosphatase (MazG superfamily)